MASRQGLFLSLLGVAAGLLAGSWLFSGSSTRPIDGAQLRPPPEQPSAPELAGAGPVTRPQQPGECCIELRLERGSIATDYVVIIDVRNDQGHLFCLVSPGQAEAISEVNSTWKAASCVVDPVTPGGALIVLRVRGLPTEEFQVAARTTGRSPITQRSKPVPARVVPDGSVVRVDLHRLDREARVRVRVHRNEEPVDGAVVRAAAGRFEISRTDVSGKDGVTISVPAETEVTLSVTEYPGWRELGGLPAPTKIILGELGETEVLFHLPGTAPVAIAATSASGEVVRASVAIWRLQEGSPPEDVSIVRIFTMDQADGWWRGQLRSGDYLARVFPTAHFSAASVRFSVEQGAVQVRVPVASNGLRAKVRILDAGGVPRPKTALNLIRPGNSLDEYVIANGVTDENGEWTSPPIEPGTYDLYLWAHWLMSVVTVAPGSGPIVLRTPPSPPTEASALEGKVLFPSGAVANGVVVELESRSDPEWRRLGLVDGNGKFLIASVADGDWQLIIRRRWTDREQFREKRLFHAVRGSGSLPLLSLEQ